MKTVLIIEHNEGFCSTISEVLALEEFKVLTAVDGIQGLKLAKNEQPDLILSGIILPGLSGYEILKKLRQDFVTAAIPLIFLTTHAAQHSRSYALQLGANDYLIKPIGLSQLLDAINFQLQRIEFDRRLCAQPHLVRPPQSCVSKLAITPLLVTFLLSVN